MALRDTWIEKREAEAASGNGNVAPSALEGRALSVAEERNMSQMHLARKGVVTEEMFFVARREKIPMAVCSVRSSAPLHELV